MQLFNGQLRHISPAVLPPFPFRQKAIDSVLLFPDHQDCQFLYIKLLGLSHATSNERKAWDKLRLESIQLYSLGAIICYDFIKYFNLKRLEETTTEANSWYTQSITSMQPGFVEGNVISLMKPGG